MSRIRVAVCLFLLSAAGASHAATALNLLGERLRNEQGEPVGKLTDLIVDVRTGRVLYLIIDAPQRFYTLPVRALREDGLLDMRDAGEIAHLSSESDPRFRRARKLIGQDVTHPHPGDVERIGTIHDFEFDPASGRINRVVLSTTDGKLAVGPGVLAHGRFPPLTQEQRDYVDREALGERGYLRREPSDARERLHDHAWQP